MSRKFPIDTRFQGLRQSNSVYLESNRYGYRININHPSIRPLYEAYHRRIGVPLHIHLTHIQRLQFDTLVHRMLEQKRRNVNVQQSHSDGSPDP